MVTRFVVNYYILPIDANASARQNVVITTFCNVTTFWVATKVFTFGLCLIFNATVYRKCVKIFIRAFFVRKTIKKKTGHVCSV